MHKFISYNLRRGDQEPPRDNCKQDDHLTKDIKSRQSYCPNGFPLVKDRLQWGFNAWYQHKVTM